MEKNDFQETETTCKKVCRTCLSKYEETKSIFEGTYKNYSLNQLLEMCTSIKVTEDDGLPVNICMVCVSKLCLTFDFIQSCKQSDNKIRSFFLNNAQENTSNEQDVIFKIDDFIEEIDCTEGYEVIEETDRFISQCLEMTQGLDIQVNIPSNQRVKKKFVKTCYSCRICGETFPTKALKNNHYIKALHPGKSVFKCHVCSKSYYGTYKFKRHMMGHSGVKPYKCSTCKMRFISKTNLIRHEKIHAGIKQYVCEICGKAFTQNVLKLHMKSHSTERSHTCNYCGKAFKHKAYLTRHKLEHGKDEMKAKNEDSFAVEQIIPINKSFSCEICNRSLSSKTCLYTHMRTHGEKQIQCDQCMKKFRSNANLRNHYRTHTGEKPYECETCKKAFAQKSSLNAHTLLHLGIKPFTCEICSRSFTQRHQLQYHKRTHTGERPYICPICKKDFALNGNLTVHMRIHTGETPYVCSTCNRGFYESSSLKKHQLSNGCNRVNYRS